MVSKKKNATRPRSGFVTEEQRHTTRVSLRLPPDMARRLKELAKKWKLTISGAVARLLEDRER